MTTSWTTLLVTGFVLAVIQYLAAVPWFIAVTRDTASAESAWSIWKQGFGIQLLGLLVVSALVGFGLSYTQDASLLGNLGRWYAVILHFQLILDFFVFFFMLLTKFWQRGGAVARAAFQESVRQPMFWFILIIALVMMGIMPFVPYFTFGEDLKMIKELGYDVIMLAALVFGVLAASMSISEEIEGRTAITLMSKPISRRQFLLGKFLGILMGSLLMSAVLGLFFMLILWFKPIYEREEVEAPLLLAQVINSLPSMGETPTMLASGVVWWGIDTIVVSTGLMLSFCHVMILIAIAVALATRLPMIVNLVICLVIFFLGHLTPVLAQVSQQRYPLVQFMAKLFDFLLPGLDYFTLGPALTRDTLPPFGLFLIYVASVTFYALVYTTIVLLGGLVLFEDRDLA